MENIALLNRPGASSVALVVRVDVGYAHSDDGCAHLLEHMVFEGSVRYPVPGELEEWAERVGGYCSAQVAFDYTEYGVRVPAAQALEAAERLLDALEAPLLQNEVAERELEVLRREEAAATFSPVEAAVEAVYELCGVGGMRWPSTGNRHTLQSFHQRWYRPEYFRVGAVGCLSQGLERSLGRVAAQVAWPPGLLVPPMVDRSLRVSPRESGDALLLLAIPLQNPPTLRQQATLSILNAALAGRRGARISRWAREHARCYEVASFVQPFRNVTLFFLALMAHPQALEELEGQLDRNLRQAACDLSDVEVEAARSYHFGTTAMHLEHPRHQAVHLTHMISLGLPALSFADPLIDPPISPEEVQHALQLLLSQPFYRVRVVP